MKIKTIFLFVCVSTACLAVQFGIYKGIVKGAVDPCPQTTTQSSTPCPIDQPLVTSCPDTSECTGYTFYSAEVKNTGYKDNKPAETYTTVEEYVSPSLGYSCATVQRCVKFDPDDQCAPYTAVSYKRGSLYTEHNCND